MKTEHVATYLTQKGHTALDITRNTSSDGRVTYSYTGKKGAGSGHLFGHVKRLVELMLATSRGVTLSKGKLEP